jgi:hypothetical protein
MTAMKPFPRLVAISVAVCSFALASAGCDALNKMKGGGDEETEPKKDDPAPEPAPATAEPAAEASASADADAAAPEASTVADATDAGTAAAGGASGGDEDVETYPEMTKAGGTYRLLRPFNVYRAADETSTKKTSLVAGTLVDFKYFYKDWIMVDYPSAPQTLSPGWIHLTQARRNTDATTATVTETETQKKKTRRPLRLKRPLTRPDASASAAPPAPAPPPAPSAAPPTPKPKTKFPGIK